MNPKLKVVFLTLIIFSSIGCINYNVMEAPSITTIQKEETGNNVQVYFSNPVYIDTVKITSNDKLMSIIGLPDTYYNIYQTNYVKIASIDELNPNTSYIVNGVMHDDKIYMNETIFIITQIDYTMSSEQNS